jgi:hypothetical protein
MTIEAVKETFYIPYYRTHKLLHLKNTSVPATYISYVLNDSPQIS